MIKIYFQLLFSKTVWLDDFFFFLYFLVLLGTATSPTPIISFFYGCILLLIIAVLFSLTACTIFWIEKTYARTRS